MFRSLFAVTIVTDMARWNQTR